AARDLDVVAVAADENAGGEAVDHLQPLDAEVGGALDVDETARAEPAAELRRVLPVLAVDDDLAVADGLDGDPRLLASAGADAQRLFAAVDAGAQQERVARLERVQ